MSRFGTHYQVARPTGHCAATEEPLEPGQECIATLCEREDDEGFDRLDFSIDAWEAGHRPPRLFSHWRTVLPEASARRKLLVDDEVLLELFERLSEDERPQRVAFRFVLGLILLRKRKLRFAGRTGRGEQERWLLAPRGAAADRPPYEVANPQLTDDDVRELTDQLSEILQSEL
ncbi:MAG: hypothetical protein ACYTGC_09995 [Planctomycetota bacterium]|jgi:hypothetical protein